MVKDECPIWKGPAIWCFSRCELGLQELEHREFVELLLLFCKSVEREGKRQRTSLDCLRVLHIELRGERRAARAPGPLWLLCRGQAQAKLKQA